MTDTRDGFRERTFADIGVDVTITHPTRHDRAVVEIDNTDLDRLTSALTALDEGGCL